MLLSFRISGASVFLVIFIHSRRESLTNRPANFQRVRPISGVLMVVSERMRNGLGVTALAIRMGGVVEVDVGRMWRRRKTFLSIVKSSPLYTMMFTNIFTSYEPPRFR